MNRVESLNRIISVFVLVCFTVATLGSSVVAAETGDKIVLKKSFWSGYKFQVGSGEKKPVYGFMSFKPDFENTLAAHPPALAEAKKSFVFNGLSLMFGVAGIVSSFSIMKEEEGPLPGLYEFNTAGIVATLGCLAGIVVTGLMGRSKLKNGVRMYNENVGSLSAVGGGFNLGNSTSISGGYAIGGTSRTSTEWNREKTDFSFSNSTVTLKVGYVF